MILVTGPTGSGKSSTLYAFLNRLRSPKLNIITVENPIEYELGGVNQVQINEKAGLTFAGTLRSILRQDPNVIMLGEIRDEETAKIAFRASMTGHLVLSTLHTNDAPSSITRLFDLGVEPFLVGSSLLGIIAQRLVRRNCQKCLETYQPLPEMIKKLGPEGASFEFYRGKGCDKCKNTGFSGRIAVFEVMPINAKIKELIAGRASEGTILKAALESGMSLLLDDAKAKIRSGITTAEEVLRCIHIEEKLTEFCPDCNNSVDIDFSVCPFCNKSLKSLCPSCGQDLKPEWSKCPYCRKEPEMEPVKEKRPAVQPRVMENPKILLVDDEDDIRKIIKFSLKRLPVSAQIMEASNGFEAIGKVEVERPDMIILDIMMPEMDGFEVCKRLRENVSTAFIPIMMLTAKGDTESKTRGFTVGTDDYVTKPFDPTELNARVMRLLRRTYGI
jgi:type IV pilus assembly protein PilB